jgi:S1-C subfamily serine protease
MGPTFQARNSFSSAFNCDQTLVKVTERSGGYATNGCGHQAFYNCDEYSCWLGVDPAADSEKKAEAAAAESRSLRLWLPGNVTQLVLTTKPEQEDKVLLSIDLGADATCQLGVMVDGQRLDAAAGAGKTELVLHRSQMLDLGTAEQVALRACQYRWALTKEDLQALRKFILEYREELAWKDDSPRSGRAGHKPPADGWPVWHPLSNFPSAVSGELTGTQLFEKLAPSVARVEAKLDGGTSQGSAVAVSKTSVITNCHVVEGSSKIIVKQGTQEWPAKLLASEPAKDRCVLEATGAQFTPVAGVRAYADLKIGEPLYTLGNPSGLDLTLANGILSSLREDEGVRFVQTTAPISPGSSGGGLFDARGNLVGITTLIYVGKERLNQSLNFAIAGEMYWTP